MKENMEKLSERKKRGINALLMSNSVKEASKQCKIPANTLYNWFLDPVFAATYKEASDIAMNTAIARVQQASQSAVEVLVKIMNTADTPPSIRLNAARAVLEIAVKGREINIKDKLNELENLINAGNRTVKMYNE